MVCWMQSYHQPGKSRTLLGTCWYRKIKCTRIQIFHSHCLNFPGTQTLCHTLSSFKSKLKKKKNHPSNSPSGKFIKTTKGAMKS